MTPQIASEKNRALCLMAPVVPVLVVDDASLAADLARALVAGGLPALEVTLRTDAALDVSVTVDDPTLGAGVDDTASTTIAITDANEAPGVSLTASLTTLSEDASTALRTKVADIVITDDSLGTNVLALSGDDALTMDATERKALLQAAGDGMLQNQTDLTALRARVGYAEARIETVTIGNANEKLSLEYAKGALLGADPYDTATRLEEVQFQLQSLYAVTVKASQLSLVNFL